MDNFIKTKQLTESRTRGLGRIKQLNPELYYKLKEFYDIKGLGKRLKREILFNSNLATDKERVHGPTKPEILVARILKKNKYKFVSEYRILGKYYDFYLLDLNVLIEVDGLYYHNKEGKFSSVMHLKNMANDKFKEFIARSKNIPLIRIWEDEITEDGLLAQLEVHEKTNTIKQQGTGV